VEEFYDLLKEIDQYEPFSLKFLKESNDPKLAQIKARASKISNFKEPSKENYFV
jgi:hypothetical protein